MNHFSNSATCLLPVGADFVGDGSEHTASACHAASPGGAESELNALDAPEEVEDLQVLFRAERGDDDVDWGVDLVFQGEDIPANLAVTQLEHAGIETAQDVGGVVLGIRVADSVFELSG